MSIPDMGAIKWRDTGKNLRFFGIDGRALFLFVVFLYHMRVWTFAMFILGVVALVLLERKGYSIPNAFRRLRVLIVGNRRPAVSISRMGRSDR